MLGVNLSEGAVQLRLGQEGNLDAGITVPIGALALISTLVLLKAFNKL